MDDLLDNNPTNAPNAAASAPGHPMEPSQADATGAGPGKNFQRASVALDASVKVRRPVNASRLWPFSFNTPPLTSLVL